MIEMRAIRKSVAMPSGDILQILQGVDLTLEQGEVVAIIGRSGSGKSTLLNVIGLLDSYDSGTFRVESGDIATLSDRDRSRLRGETFGFVFQQFFLLPGRTAAANVAAPLAHAPAAAFGDRDKRAAELLERIGLSDRASSLPSQLSGGEQQRVAIARALVRNPAVILADEPTGSLDTGTGDSVLALLLDLVRSGDRTLVLVTHDPVVAGVADRRYELGDGVLHRL